MLYDLGSSFSSDLLNLIHFPPFIIIGVITNLLTVVLLHSDRADRFKSNTYFLLKVFSFVALLCLLILLPDPFFHAVTFLSIGNSISAVIYSNYIIPVFDTLYFFPIIDIFITIDIFILVCRLCVILFLSISPFLVLFIH